MFDGLHLKFLTYANSKSINERAKAIQLQREWINYKYKPVTKYKLALVARVGVYDMLTLNNSNNIPVKHNLIFIIILL